MAALVQYRGRMRLTIVLGIIYLAILKMSHAGYRVFSRREPSEGIVWGSIFPHDGKAS